MKKTHAHIILDAMIAHENTKPLWTMKDFQK